MSEQQVAEANHELRPTSPRWTHIALRTSDLDASIAWYERHTPLRELARNRDELGRGVWLGQPDNADRPFILVLAEFIPDKDPFGAETKEVLAPFAHIGIELPDRAAVDAAAELAREHGCLTMEPRHLNDFVGYICMVADPDGNTIEFSYDQGVYEKAREVWGS